MFIPAAFICAVAGPNCSKILNVGLKNTVKAKRTGIDFFTIRVKFDGACAAFDALRGIGRYVHEIMRNVPHRMKRDDGPCLVLPAIGRMGGRMKLYDGGRAPNPRRVRVFLAEKGIEPPPMVAIDLGAMQQKSSAFSAVNPLQRVPALELDDGTVITESVAICRYFEALHPDPPLFGREAKDIALIEMWNRRLELHLLLPVSHVFRHSHPAMKQMENPQVADWAEANKPRVSEFLAILDTELRNRPFIVGDHYTIADITGFIAVEFMKPAKLLVPEDLRNVRRWYESVSARPSAKA